MYAKKLLNKLTLAALLTAAPACLLYVSSVQAATEQATVDKIVYHINDSSVASAALRNVQNNLNADPTAKIVVVTHGKGIDFLLNDAKNEKGEAYEPAVANLVNQGVEFRVCNNTLKGRKLDKDAVIPEASIVPSGVAEIAKLQSREGYVYIKP